MSAKTRNSRICIFLLLLVSMLSAGTDTARAISIKEEKELSEKYMEMIRKNQTLIKDPIVCNLVESVGREILAEVPPSPFNFSFYAVDNDSFNAFAAPGANIFLNRELIVSLDTVDELAGIIGHEIAHASLRHISQIIDKSKIVSLGSLAGIIAGALIGGASGEADIGQAVIAGSMAAGQTAILSYSREHEKEADQLGYNYLSHTGFSPEGLLTSLEKIRARDYYGTEDIPDYFKTHPGIRKRISFLESLLKSRPAGSGLPEKDSYRFDMVKARLTGLYDKPDQAVEQFTNLLNSHPDTVAFHYGLALALARQSRVEKALESLRSALEINAFDPMLLLESGRLALLNSDAQNAADILEGIKDDPMVGLMATYHLGRAEIELGRLTRAEQHLDRVIRKLPDFYPKAHYHRARIHSEKGENTLSHYHLGVYYTKIDSMENARFHLKKALSGRLDENFKKEAKELLQEAEETKDRQRGPGKKFSGKRENPFHGPAGFFSKYPDHSLQQESGPFQNTGQEYHP